MGVGAHWLCSLGLYIIGQELHVLIVLCISAMFILGSARTKEQQKIKYKKNFQTKSSYNLIQCVWEVDFIILSLSVSLSVYVCVRVSLSVCAHVGVRLCITVVTAAHSQRAQCLIPGCKMDYLVAGGWKDSSVLALKKETQVCVCMRMHVICAVDSPGDLVAP